MSTTLINSIVRTLTRDTPESKCIKVASSYFCFQACFEFVRGSSIQSRIEREERRETITIAPITSLPNCLTYRQIQGAGFGAAGSAPAKRVPVLFSTNCGLYLRLTQSPMNDEQIGGNSQRYNISFCDLERWSTNRANVVSLEDTFNIISPAPGENQQRLWNNYAAYHHQFKYDLESN